MAVALVVFNGTRLNSSDSNTGWGNFNIGGGSPASEPANAYQQDTPGSAVGAVGKKINSTTSRQGVDYNGTAQNFSGNGSLWYCKVYVADGFNVNSTFGVEVGIGSSDSSNSHRYNIAGSGATNDAFLTYPPQGGYIIIAIDPTIDGWADTADQGGTFNQASVVWYMVAAQFITGEAKSENVAMDAIDIGTGLTLTAGGGVDPDGTFISFVDFDQDIKSNRYGVVVGSGSNVKARGLLTIGDATITSFIDTDSIVSFPDGYHSTGKFGVACDVTNLSTVIQIDSLLIGEGDFYATQNTDTRPDFTVTGTLGTFTCAATMRNFRNITFNSTGSVENADLECKLLTQNSCDISNTTIRTLAAGDEACIQDPTFGTTTDLHDITFIQGKGGVGHAIELDTATTYDFTNLNFIGYGVTGASNAALDVSATTGTVTININGGSTPTYKTAGATVVINNTVNVKVVAKTITGVNIENARVLLEADTGGDLADGTDILTGLTDVNGEALNAGFNFTNNQPIKGWIRKSTTTPFYKQGIISGTITNNGFEATIILILDE